MATICVLGLWHQGSILSACLANLGHTVWGVDDDERVVAGLQAARAPVVEPKLERLLRRNLKAGRLHFTTEYGAALQRAEFVYIAIDTPLGPGDEPDLRSIFSAARRAGRAISRPSIVIVSAQVPVGTCEHIADLIREEKPAARFAIVYVPEFLRLGVAVDTFRRADRFVVGANDAAVAERVAALYRPLRRPIVMTDIRTAEMAKHASNAFLAMSISAINELADLCDKVGADVMKVAEIMRLDRRIGPHAYLSPGLGFAGGTLSRDIRALQQLGREHGCGTLLLDAVLRVNEARAGLVGQRLQDIYTSLEGLEVGILGLTYKSGTSTLRRSIAVDIISDLVKRGASVKAFDPLARLDETDALPSFVLCADPYAAAQSCDAVVFITKWEGIDRLDVSRLRANMRRPVVIDTQNLLDPIKMREAGFLYSGVGRGAPVARRAGGGGMRA